jgi:hypothetical protein
MIANPLLWVLLTHEWKDITLENAGIRSNR